MFYCPNCNNTYDIARSSSQVGGAMEGFDDFPSSESEHQAVDIIDGGKSGQVDPLTVINAILNTGTAPKDDIINLDIAALIKNAEYKKLKNDQKELIYNTIQDILPENKKKIVDSKIDTVSDDDNLAFFVCSNCGYSVKIEDGTKIFSRTADDVSQSYVSGDYSNMIHSSILPRTRKFVCPNSKCESFKDPKKREAVFFRKNNSYNIVYICTACETIF